MIKVGHKTKIKYWGNYTVERIAQLKKPVECYSEEIGAALFHPTIVKISWEKPPSKDMHEFWFPYWMTIRGKEKYGQFAPMIGENALLELIEEAIGQDFFSKGFLSSLDKTISERLNSEQATI
jgi:hypothetical protein